MTSLLEQIDAARQKAGWSVQRLLDESGLGVERSVLQRKLTGKTPMTVDEAQALAKALDITIAWAPTAQGKAS